MWGLSKEEIESRNVLFLEDPDYVQKIMSAILNESSAISNL